MPLKPIAIREKIFLIGVSFMLSLMLWLQVSAQADPNKQREFLIRLEARGLARDLFVTDLPDGITVVAEGSEKDLERIEPEELVATVNLTGLKPGTHALKVKVPELRTPLRLRTKRSTVQVSIDRLATSVRPVVIEFRGQIQSGLRFDGATAEPATVTISGPGKELVRAQKVRAMLDLSQVRPGAFQTIELEVLGADNVPLSRVQASPQSVNVLPAVAAAPTSKSLPISPTWKGVPPFPFVVKRYEITPNVVSLTGDGAALAKALTVATEPIDISSLRESKVYSVKLVLPEGLQAPADLLVKIVVEVTRSPR